MHSLRRAGLAALRRRAGVPGTPGALPTRRNAALSSDGAHAQHSKKSPARGETMARGAVAGPPGVRGRTDEHLHDRPDSGSGGRRAATDPAGLAKRLRAGLDYERQVFERERKAFADFQQFLCNHLGELETALVAQEAGGSAAPAREAAELAAVLAGIRAEAVSYGAMDARGRDDLLRRLGSALYRHERAAGATAPAPKPQAWRPPASAKPAAPPPRQRANSGAQRRENFPATDANRASAWGPGPRDDGGSSGSSSLPGGAPLPASEPRVPSTVPSGSSPSASKARSSEIPIVIAFDLETTGLSKDKNRIIEIAAVNVTDPTHAPMSTLINPGRFNIPPPITQLTGITNSMVSAPAVPSFARAAELLEEYVTEARRKGGGASVILAAHNARQFDAGFLQAEYRRLGRELPDDWRFDTAAHASGWTRTRSGRLGGTSPRTSSAAGRPRAHRAQADARMLGNVLQGVLGVSLEGTAGPGAAEAVKARGDTEKLREAVEAMSMHSFSLGDPSKNSLRRQTAASATTYSYAAARPATTTGAGAPAAPSFGATPIVTSDRGEIDVLGSGGIAAAELDDLSESEDEDEDDESYAASRRAAAPEPNNRPPRKPFWIAADPINGFVPETGLFARMTEASDSKASVADLKGAAEPSGSKSGSKSKKGSDPVDPALAALHARLRRDHAAWAEIPVDALKEHGVSARLTNALKKADVTTVERVLRCYPRKYQEFARYRPEMQNGTAVLVVGTVGSFLKAPPSRKGWGHKTPATLLVDVFFEDHEADARGQKSRSETFEMKLWEYVPVDVERSLAPGAPVCVRGILSGKTPRGFITLEKPTLAMHVDQNAQVEVVPTYPKKHDVAPEKWPDIQRAAVEALKARLPADPMTVSLGMESTVLPELNLMSHVDAMKHIHRPDSVERVCEARERLAFEELVLLQTSLLRERERAQNSGGEGVSVVSTALCDELRSVLDFSLTRGQENAMEEIFHDMAARSPLRMLQGDVGAQDHRRRARDSRRRGAPGRVHGPPEVARSSTPRRSQAAWAPVEPPEGHLIDGEHDQEGTRRRAGGDRGRHREGDRGDAQPHLRRRGVCQPRHRRGGRAAPLRCRAVSRARLEGPHRRLRRAGRGPGRAASIVAKENEAAERGAAAKRAAAKAEEDGDAADAAAWAAAADDGEAGDAGADVDTDATENSAPEKPPIVSDGGSDDLVPWRHAPHMLAMSATPIPRTLAMCKHGEMALSSIDEKPAGRLPIHTRRYRRTPVAYEAMTSKSRPAVSATSSRPGGDVHGGVLRAAQVRGGEFAWRNVPRRALRDAARQDELGGEERRAGRFHCRETQVLVATSVVEVGVDVPNASVIIEDADRHGVSTLPSRADASAVDTNRARVSCSSARKPGTPRKIVCACSRRPTTASTSPRAICVCGAPEICWAPGRAAGRWTCSTPPCRRICTCWRRRDEPPRRPSLARTCAARRSRRPSPSRCATNRSRKTSTCEFWVFFIYVIGHDVRAQSGVYAIAMSSADTTVLYGRTARRS